MAKRIILPKKFIFQEKGEDKYVDKAYALIRRNDMRYCEVCRLWVQHDWFKSWILTLSM